MTFQEFQQAAFACALEKGCTAAELCQVESENFSVCVEEQKLERYSVSTSLSAGLRVKLEGRDGYASTEVLEEPEVLVDRAMDNARCVEDTDERPMQGPQVYTPVEVPQDPILNYSEGQKIELARKLETLVRARDSRVKRVEHNTVATGKSTVRLANTLGLLAERTQNLSFVMTEAILQDGEELRDGSMFRAGRRVLDLEGCAREAVEEAAVQFGAQPVAPGEYRVLLRNTVATDLIQAFFSLFSADAAQKGLSLLKGREGEQIGSPKVTLVDDPFFEENPRSFDDEGTPSQKTTVVEKGKFLTMLHNLATAKKAGVESTSNGGRFSAGSPVGVSPSNFYLVPGEKSFEELVQELGVGLVSTEVSCLHAGVNSVSGEFSLLSRGLLVEKGRMVRPVAQITAAGTFLKLLQAVEEVGSDLFLGMPGGSLVASPSVLIRGLMISGK